MSKIELEKLDLLISPLVKKSQSLSHMHHKDEIPCSQRTLYNYFEMNLFEARNIDLPRKVRCKPRKKLHPKISNKLNADTVVHMKISKLLSKIVQKHLLWKWILLRVLKVEKYYLHCSLGTVHL